MIEALIVKTKRLKTILILLLRAYYLYRRNYKDRMYNLIGDELFDLGGVYVKFLQGVILQSWLMKRWRNDRKLDIFEKINPQDLDVEAILRKNLKSKADQIIKIDEQPFAVGSFGQVYKAQLKQDRQVIVKILSPDISRSLKFDLRLLQFFWRFHLRSVKANQGINIKKTFKDFKLQTLREVDYISEAEFAHEQYLTYRNHPYLKIPKTHLELCGKEVIVQDYVDGISITQLMKLKDKDKNIDLKQYVKKELGSDLVHQLSTLSYEILWGTFHYPRIMGDPHPGNVILLKNNHISLIDFGISAQGVREQAAFLKLLKSLEKMSQGDLDIQNTFLAGLQFFGRELYLALTKLSQFLPLKQKNLNEQLAKAIQDNFQEMHPGQDMRALIRSPKALVIFHRLINNNNRFGFKLKIYDMEVIRAFTTLTSLLDAVGVYNDVIEPTYCKVIKKVEKTYPDLETFVDKDISHGQAISIAEAWLERIAGRDPGLFANLVKTMKLKNHKELMKHTASMKKEENIVE